jgi:hypothetical protein
LFVSSVFNNLNPAWSTVIFLEGYKFGVPFYIEVGVFDFDARQAGASERELQLHDALSNVNIVSNASSRKLLRNGQFPHKVMGTALFEVGEILGARGNVGSKSLQTGGAVYAHIERCREDGEKGKLLFQLRGLRLKNVQTFGSTSSPYYEMLRKVERPTGATWYVHVTLRFGFSFFATSSVACACLLCGRRGPHSLFLFQFW